MSNERLNEAPRFIILGPDAESNVGPGFWGAFGYYLKPERYGTTTGRATRKEYCGFIVGEILLGSLVKFSAFLAFVGIGIAAQTSPALPLFLYYLVKLFWTIWVFTPRLAVFVRRLHDLGISGKRILAPSAVFLVGYGVFVAGVGVEAWSEDAWTWETLNGVAIVGAVLTALGSVWSARYGLPALFCCGEAGPNRFGGERWNPTRERPFRETIAPKKICPRCQAKNPANATFCDICDTDFEPVESAAPLRKTAGAAENREAEAAEA